MIEPCQSVWLPVSLDGLLRSAWMNYMYIFSYSSQALTDLQLVLDLLMSLRVVPQSSILDFQSMFSNRNKDRFTYCSALRLVLLIHRHLAKSPVWSPIVSPLVWQFVTVAWLGAQIKWDFRSNIMKKTTYLWWLFQTNSGGINLLPMLQLPFSIQGEYLMIMTWCCCISEP